MHPKGEVEVTVLVHDAADGGEVVVAQAVRVVVPGRVVAWAQRT